MNLRTASLLALGSLVAPTVTAQEAGTCVNRRLSFAWDGHWNVHGDCNFGMVSADGRYAAFHSLADNLVPVDTNHQYDIFVVDVETKVVELVSVSNTGEQANLKSQVPSISSDGRYVAFHSFAGNLVAGDTNGISDVFLRDRQAGTTERVSISSTGAQANGLSYKAAISGDGRFVAFCSEAVNLVANDQNGFSDVFLHDRVTGTTVRVNEAVGGGDADRDTTNLTYLWRRFSVSDDGRYVAFGSSATNLVVGDSNGFDIFVRDVVAGTTHLASVSSTGGSAGGSCHVPTISADGRFVAFEGHGSNLVPGDTNNKPDVFRHDLQTGETIRVNTTSAGAQSMAEAKVPAISPCGRYVGFQVDTDDLVAGDTNGKTDVYVKDLETGAVWRASIATDGTEGNRGCGLASLSAGAEVVTYSSNSTTLGGGNTNSTDNVFARTCGLSGPEAYCTAKVSSAGCTPMISFSGLPTYTQQDDFQVLAESIVSEQPGIMLWSTAPADIPFHGGTLCASAPHFRTSIQLSGGSGTPDCTGTFAFPFTQAYMAAAGLGVGSSVYAQYYFRDPMHLDGTSVGLSDGLKFEILP